MLVQLGLCQTWLETPKTGFLALWLTLYQVNKTSLGLVIVYKYLTCVFRLFMLSKMLHSRSILAFYVNISFVGMVGLFVGRPEINPHMRNMSLMKI